MYIHKINIQNFRVFKKTGIDFVHPDQNFARIKLPKPVFPNINLLLGDNGSGKTTLLKAVALAALGPSVRDSGVIAYRLVRREPGSSKTAPGKRAPATYKKTEAVLEADFISHAQDGGSRLPDTIKSRVSILKRRDLEGLHWSYPSEKNWHPIFSEETDAFFFVGYGATRRVESRDTLDMGSRRASAIIRAQRIRSLFEETYSLVPLNSWLPEYKHSNPGRHKQVVNLINRLMPAGSYSFSGAMEGNEYTYSKEKLNIPFPALSDGYRAYLGWIGDLLYHLCRCCPSGKKLVDNQGIVMVDEIDLHLHPEWQMSVLPVLSRALPKIQFILTSHSPLLVGSLEWMNIITMEEGPKQSSVMERLRHPVNGLDADQILLTDFFGLPSTRAEAKHKQLQKLNEKARRGDKKAAIEVLNALSRGCEGVE